MNPYVDPATGVPYNKLGINDAAQLTLAEYKLTRLRGLELQNQPILGRFDYEHLKAIHKTLFQDVYAWAGQPRTVNFSKKDASEPWWKTRFEEVQKIAPTMNVVAGMLKDANYLRDLPRAAFAKEIARVYVVLNNAHPFPEGNGRSTQTFLKQLAVEAGHDLDFGQVTRAEWVKAAARSMEQVNVREPSLKRKGDSTLIEAAFQKIVVPQRAMTQEAQARASAHSRLADAFVSMPEDQARRAYPQLAGAFERLHAVATEAQRRGLEPAAVSYVVDSARAQLGRQLRAGQQLPAHRAQGQGYGQER